MNNEQKQAIEYGVPMPETCEQMDWQNETHFYWCFQQTNIDCYVCCFNKQEEGYERADGGEFPPYENEFFSCPAPQMHEIKNEIRKRLPNTNTDGCVNAQTCAELYIKLKNEGLLK